jgi:peptidoglycan/xylan/chitin deacetylase (PgdA/CDA1 family)
VSELDAFWGLPAGGPLKVAPGGGERWERIELLDLPPYEGARILAPVPSPLAGDPLVRARRADGTTLALAARDEDGAVLLGLDVEAAVGDLTSRAALTPRPPASARLPVPYHRVPAPLRRLLRDLLARRAAGRDRFPDWPVEPSVEALRLLWLRARQAAEPELAPRPFWPEGKRFALCLTHDVDTAAGLARAPAFAGDEAERGLASCSYVVGGDFPLDAGAMAALAEAGEVGLHDVAHDNRIAFLAPEEIGRRLDGARELVERFGMRGFRSPSMLRTDALYAALAGRFEYDSSMPDTGLLPERNGCAGVFPLRRGGVDVLPLTLPPDGQLLARGLDPLAAWIEKADWVRAAGGVAVALTHPEQGFSAAPAMRAAYRRFLDWAAAQDDAWHATPAEVMRHWRERRG